MEIRRMIMPGGSLSARHAVSASVVTAVFLALCFLFVPAVRVLTITDVRDEKLLYCEKVKPGDAFSISYIHSVNKSPVEDYFIIGGDSAVILDKTVFRSFGAGVPASSSDGGVFRFYDDRIEVTGINRRIDRFLLFIGVTAEHRFRMNGTGLLLRQISAPQRTLGFSVERVSLSDYFSH